METGVVSSLIQQVSRKKRIKHKQFISVQLQWLSLLLNRENLCDPGLINCHITDYPNMKVLEHQQYIFFLLTNVFRAQGDSSSLLHATWLGTFKMVSSHGWHVSVLLAESSDRLQAQDSGSSSCEPLHGLLALPYNMDARFWNEPPDRARQKCVCFCDLEFTLVTSATACQSRQSERPVQI